METDRDIQDDFHGTDGPIPVLHYNRRELLPFQEAFYQSCLDAGYPESPDVNHPEATGISPTATTTSKASASARLWRTSTPTVTA